MLCEHQPEAPGELPVSEQWLLEHFSLAIDLGNTREMATVPIELNLFNGQHGTEWNYMMAASTISILPTAI